MKILNLRLANINSLKGDFEIDFTNPDLAGRGIFAILGLTGSGKTTVLDAITLALFGRTPRLTVAASENELMTRGAGFCRAEVTFEAKVDGRTLRFRSAWEQWRARKASNGSLQNPKMHLVQLDGKIHGDDYETSKLSEVPVRVEAVTGLNYNRFTRTCLLAQGQFAAFLDAKSGDRAQILEQITGTDIYFKLSQAAFLRDKEVSDKVEALRNELQGVNLITDEEFSSLEQSVTALCLVRNECDLQKQTIQSQITWVKSLNALLENNKNTLEQEQCMFTERAGHAADFSSLADGRRAETVRAALLHRDGLIEKRQKREIVLNETRRQLPGSHQAVQTAQNHLVKSVKEAEAFQPVAETEKQLIKEVRTCDQHTQGLSDIHTQIGVQKASLSSQISEAETLVKSVAKTVSDSRVLQQSLRDSLESSAPDKSLGTDLKALEALDSQRKEITSRLSKADKDVEDSKKTILRAVDELKIVDKTVKAAEKEFQKQIAILQTAEKHLSSGFPGVSVATLQEQIVKAQKNQVNAKGLHDIASEILNLSEEEKNATSTFTTRSKEFASAKEALAGLEKSREQSEAVIEELNEQKLIFQTMASLEDQRQQLEKGKPCPLCGSLEHPYSIEKVPSAGSKELELQLKKEKAGLKKIIESLKETQSFLNKLTALQAADESLIKTCTGTLANRQKSWNKLIKDFDQPPTPDETEKLDALVTASDKALQEAQTAFDQFQNAENTFNNAEKAVNKAKEKLQDYEKKQATGQGNLDKAEALGKKTVDQRVEFETVFQQIEEKLRSEILSLGFSEYDETVLPRLKARWESYQALQKRLELEIQSEQRSLQKLVAATTEKEGLHRQLGECQKAFEKSEGELLSAHATRTALYGDKNTDVEEKKLQAELNRLQEDEQQARKQAQELQFSLGQLQATEKTLAEELTALSNELAEANRIHEQVRANAGFPDDETLRTAFLPADELKRLSDLEKQFENRAAQLHGQLEGLKKQISEHEESRPTTQTLEELVQAEILVTEKAAHALTTWQEQWKILNSHQENRKKHQDLVGRIGATQKAGERWSKLHFLIGSSNGKKFQEFAQGLTFASLVFQANQQLNKLSDRYLLDNQGLELQVIDRYIANARASAKNLSGGEKFLASLALALGLAQMVGRKYRMDTLFIDEGFGALDPQTLETAISVLCSLQQQGKLIGIISHVKSLEERLPVRLEVQRLGGGLSTIIGPGCTRHS